MLKLAKKVIFTTDAALASLSLTFKRERSALMAFLFHSLFRDESEMALNLVDPMDRTSVATFEHLIEYYRRLDYLFITPRELEHGLDATRPYAMLTFDDGYFNNSLALPILEKHQVPATFFISTEHVREQKSYWWDALYREMTRAGATPAQVAKEAGELKSRRTCEIEKILLERYGPEALRPRGDIDRPFTIDELRQLAKSPWVCLGNHTADHAILTNYPQSEVDAQIAGAQEALRELTGRAPSAIAFPNGNFTEQTVAACRSAGLKFGFTVRQEKSPLPLQQDPMLLGRFIPTGDRRIESQCRTFRSDIRLQSGLAGIYRSLRGSKK